MVKWSSPPRGSIKINVDAWCFGEGKMDGDLSKKMKKKITFFEKKKRIIFVKESFLIYVYIFVK